MICQRAIGFMAMAWIVTAGHGHLSWSGSLTV
jgi:hypothetical protein